MGDRGKLICEALKRNGVKHIAWVPDSETHFMHDAMLNDPALHIVQVCAEGEAVSICAGLHLGGARGVALIENQGAFDAGNALKWAVGLKFPLVLLIGYLGYHDMKESAEGRTRGGRKDVTEPFFQALDIPCHLVDSDADVAKVSQAFADAEQLCKPVAVLLTSADDFRPGM